MRARPAELGPAPVRSAARHTLVWTSTLHPGYLKCAPAPPHLVAELQQGMGERNVQGVQLRTEPCRGPVELGWAQGFQGVREGVAVHRQGSLGLGEEAEQGPDVVGVLVVGPSDGVHRVCPGRLSHVPLWRHGPFWRPQSHRSALQAHRRIDLCGLTRPGVL